LTETTVSGPPEQAIPVTSGRMALLGTGYIGGSLLLGLRRAGLITRSVGFDADPAVLKAALDRGIVDEMAVSPAEAVKEADVVVLATPVGATAAVAAAMAPGLSPGCLVFDLGSIKTSVVAAVEAALAGTGAHFVGTHPIAGQEFRGPAAADGTLFTGRLCIVTPTSNTVPAALGHCVRLWQTVGARIAQIDPVLHDQVLGAISHLPHLASFALAATVEALLGREEGQARAAHGMWGGGFADTTRIAASNPVMWRDILLGNRDVLLPLVEAMIDELAGLRRAMADGDGEALVETIQRAARGRRQVMGG
jgi:prephenate dehydrogenase